MGAEVDEIAPMMKSQDVGVGHGLQTGGFIRQQFAARARSSYSASVTDAMVRDGLLRGTFRFWARPRRACSDPR